MEEKTRFLIETFSPTVRQDLDDAGCKSERFNKKYSWVTFPDNVQIEDSLENNFFRGSGVFESFKKIVRDGKKIGEMRSVLATVPEVAYSIYFEKDFS